MRTKPSAKIGNHLVAAVIALVAAMVGYSNWREARRSTEGAMPLLGSRSGALGTAPNDLPGAIEQLKARLTAKPDDGHTAARLADALMRQARITSDGAFAIEAEQALKRVLEEEPGDYEARRMLGVVYLSQHRFRDAVREAERTRDMNPTDAANYGVIGDGHVELGEYDEAFDAFQRMMNLRPNAAAYGRAAYARELQGDLEGALRLMKMAADATGGHDPEARAWHHAQIGDLYFAMGRLADARREYELALLVFPDHPYGVRGVARVKAAEGDHESALALYRGQLERGPTPEIAAHIGDLYGRLGRTAEAERAYDQAERLEREGWRLEEPQPAALARFLAERDRKIDEAVWLAERAAANRKDIFTEDALAWSYFKAGRLGDAVAAIDRALRTGTRDRRILYHAAAIKKAAGDAPAARRFAERALEGSPHFDLLAAPAAARLLATLDPRSSGSGLQPSH